MRKAVPKHVYTLAIALALCTHLLCFTSAARAQQTPPAAGGSAKPGRDLEAEAFDLIVEISAADSDDRRIAAVRKLADYRLPSVAQALVHLLEEAGLSPPVDREVEWALATLSGTTLPPLAEALAAGSISSDATLLVMTRIARQDPAIVAPLLGHPSESVARSAALAIALSRHPEAPPLLEAAFETLPDAAAGALLTIACHRKDPSCRPWLDKALASQRTELLLTAVSLISGAKDEDLGARVQPLLHHRDRRVVRAALEALLKKGIRGQEKDLEILFEEAPHDVREQLLEVFAATPESECLAFLKRLTRQYPANSDLGRRIHELYRARAGQTVLRNKERGAKPVDGLLEANGKAGYVLVLHNEEGYRVAVGGELYLRCKGEGRRRVRVKADDFKEDGSLIVEARCARGGPPEASWKCRNGHQFRARLKDLERP